MPRKVYSLAVTTNGKPTKSIGTAEVKCKSSYHDKQSGSYGRVTTKESVSSGDYSNRGRVGYKDEYKASSTVRVGDKRGYTEYSRQEKFTRVDYGGSNNTNYGGNLICGGDDDASDSDGGYEDHGYSSEGTVAQDEDNVDCGDSYDDDDSYGDDGVDDSYDDVDNDDFDDDDGCDDDSYDSDGY